MDSVTRKSIAAMADAGWTYAEIARHFGIPRGSVGRIIHHVRHGYGVTKDEPESFKSAEPHHVIRDLEPAKHPFEPDDSVPDFAHDEAHCQAVQAHGGFPVMPKGRAA